MRAPFVRHISGWCVAVAMLATCLAGGALGCGGGGADDTVDAGPGLVSKWELWSTNVELRGANVWIGRADDPIYEGALGPGPYGPTFTQQDFDALAAAGANYVNISHPGLFSIKAPYGVDNDAQANLDGLITMIGKADMFAVISVRTGPGRSEWTFHWGNDTTTDPVNGWFPKSYYDEGVWQASTVQDQWAAMWAHIADRYKDSKVVVGYDLMCEPNGHLTQLGLGDPSEFYPAHAGEITDWNAMYPKLVTAVRAVDATTPIVVGGMGYSGIDWLPYVEPVDDPYLILGVHQYQPDEYTHQEPGANVSYPGTIGGTTFDATAMAQLFLPISQVKNTHDVPVVCNEIGLTRWSPNAEVFMTDQLEILEGLGVGWAMWAWEIAAGVNDGEQDAFNFRLGPEPTNLTDEPSNALYTLLRSYWARNRYRPSNAGF